MTTPPANGEVDLTISTKRRVRRLEDWRVKAQEQLEHHSEELKEITSLGRRIEVEMVAIKLQSKVAIWFLGFITLGVFSATGALLWRIATSR